MKSPYGLIPRCGAVSAVLVIETLLVSGLIQQAPLDALTGAAKHLHTVQHLLFRFCIAYGAFLAILTYLQGHARLAAISATAEVAPLRPTYAALHLLAVGAFAYVSSLLYRDADAGVYWSVIAVWHLCGLGAALSLLAAAAPARCWQQALRMTGRLPLFAFLPAAGAMLVLSLSQMLWAPAATVTFQLVQYLLLPLYPDLRADTATLTFYTHNFEVTVSEVCSGLEGVGLMLAFCFAWLWYFRSEYRFPRALIIVPIAVALIFLLNAVRIAALVLIGSAGYWRVAQVGFHSQAGWIAFNLAALGIAVFTRRSAWLSRPVRSALPLTDASANSPVTAAYLVPLLVTLAAGMVAHAMSAGFDIFYALRLLCGALALIAYRTAYRQLDFHFTWRGIAVGIGIFVLWLACARYLTEPESMPESLRRWPALSAGIWIALRAASAVLMVPLAEELAYRGFLMRRLVRNDFESLKFREVPLWALALAALAFGATHGHLWFAGVVAGLAYGALAIYTGKIGESVAAHATTNSLLAIYVLLFDQWQLW